MTVNGKQPIAKTGPEDGALRLVWFLEDPPSDPSSQVLTNAALDNIANHKYVAGDYTWLDNTCNPMWAMLTELLPYRMAPNLVTLLGALHCFVSYVLTWIEAPLGVEPIPSYVFTVNAYCLFVGYTLDCMDGKQARRTGTSSPLGHLLDHGLDCLCMLAHVASVQAWLRAGDTLRLQMTLQLLFHICQWEEYYTRILPHATGPIGVTEVNYGLALLSLLHGTIFHDMSARGPYDVLIIDDVEWLIQTGTLSQRLVDILLNIFVPGPEPSLIKLAYIVDGWTRRDMVIVSWCTLLTIFALLALRRVCLHLTKISYQSTAILQLASPFAVYLIALVDEWDTTITPTNRAAIQTTIRWKSLAIGLLFCVLTVKVIVFSMARQPVAVFQWDVTPLVGAILLTVYDTRLCLEGHLLVWQTLAALWGLRLLYWSSAATQQITKRLQIHVWTIQPQSVQSDNVNVASDFHGS